MTNLILIDCASTAHLFINQNMVQNIRKAVFLLCLRINNSTNILEKEAMCDDITIQFNEDAIANVLRFELLIETGIVALDSAKYSFMFYFPEKKGWIEFDKL